MDKGIREIIRNVLWEEAKGKLNALLQTYQDGEDFDDVAEMIQYFINDLDNELL